MARINIEDGLYKDRRFTDLCIALGSRTMALGALVEAWTEAQKNHSLDNIKALIPTKDWKEQRLNDAIVTSGLARIEGDSFYMLGAEEQFQWLTTSKINAAKGGHAKAEAARLRKDAQEEPIDSDTCLTAAPRQAGGKQKASRTLPSYSSSSSFSSSDSNSSSDSLFEEGTELSPAPSARVTKVSPRGAIGEFSNDSVSSNLLRNVAQKLQHTWLEAYPDADWVVQELRRANAWIAANPRKSPKDFGKFMTNWLSRGFEAYRKGIPSRRQTSSEINAQAMSEYYQKIDEGG